MKRHADARLAARLGLRLRRTVALGAVLAATTVLVPDSGVRPPTMSLLRVDVLEGVDHPKNVVWVLMMGSDARAGERIDRSRADAIQLVGLNLETGDGFIMGTPRDMWVSIPGSGSQRVNAALYFGGPRLMARTVGELYGIDIDYAFVTGFSGLAKMIRSIGGVTVNSRLAFSDDNLPGSYEKGKNHVNGRHAVLFGRMRHFLPAGDFDRSANQGELIRAVARKVKAKQDVPGFIERGLLSVLGELDTSLSPAEVFRLAQAATAVKPGRLRGCVLSGSFGNIGGASIIFPNRAQATAIGNDVRGDARLDNRRLCD